MSDENKTAFEKAMDFLMDFLDEAASDPWTPEDHAIIEWIQEELYNYNDLRNS